MDSSSELEISAVNRRSVPTLALVTLCKDDPGGLRRTLESTVRLRARYPVIHRVIDGSDREREEVGRVIDSYPGVLYCWVEPNGTSDALNHALDMVEEPWVWFLNSGDELLESFNLNLLTELLTHTTAQVVTFSIIDENGDPSRRPPLPFMWPPLFTWLCILATVFRTEQLKLIGGFDRSFKIANDGEMWFRLLGRRSVTLDIVSVPMVRMEPAGMSGNRRAVATEALGYLKKHRYIILKRWLQGGLRYFEAKRKFRRRLDS